MLLRASLFSLLLGWLCLQPALAQTPPPVTAAHEPAALSPASALAQADSADRAELITQWAAQANPRLLPLLSALEEGRLLVDAQQHPYIQNEQGLVDANTGARSGLDPNTLETINPNNSVRAAIDTVRAAMQLSAPQAEQRLQAVKVLRDHPHPALLPLLDRQLAQETQSELRAEMRLAQAELQLASPQAALRLQAVQSLAQSSDPATKSKLQPLLDPNQESDAQVRAAAAKSIQTLDSRQFTYDMIGHAFSGLSLGSVLLLAALGLAITYGLLGVINMAHGEMLMLGAYTTYVVQSLFRSHLPGAVDWYLLAALPAAFAVTAMVGMALERLVIRHLYGRPLETLLATWGISLMLIQSIRMLFGAQNVEVANPAWLSGGWHLTAALTLPYNRIAIIAFVLAVLALTWFLLNRTRLGLFVRAVTQNRRMADAVGVPTGRVDMLAFGLGSGIAGLGGVALSQIGNVGPELGQGYIVDSFMVVVLGGVGQLAGTVLGAMGLGVVNKILEPQIGAVLGKIVILAFIILFIQKRPQGLFALKGRVID